MRSYRGCASNLATNSNAQTYLPIIMGKQLLGIALLILSLFMLFGLFKADVAASGATLAITVLIAIAAPAAGGGYLLWSSSSARGRERSRLRQRKDVLRRQTLAAELLKLAERRDGRLTVVEAVAELAFDAATIDEALQNMAVEGLAEVQLSESGVLVYAFYDVQHLAEKATAKGVLDA